MDYSSSGLSQGSCVRGLTFYTRDLYQFESLSLGIDLKQANLDKDTQIWRLDVYILFLRFFFMRTNFKETPREKNNLLCRIIEK